MSFVNPTPDSELDAERAERCKAELRTSNQRVPHVEHPTNNYLFKRMLVYFGFNPELPCRVSEVLDAIAAKSSPSETSGCAECAENLRDTQRANQMQDQLAGDLKRALELLRRHTAFDYTLELPADVQSFVDSLTKPRAAEETP